MAYTNPQVGRLMGWAKRAKLGAEHIYFTTPPGTGEYDTPHDIFAAARNLVERGGFLPFQRKREGGTDYTLRRVSPAAVAALNAVAKFKPERTQYAPDRR